MAAQTRASDTHHRDKPVTVSHAHSIRRVHLTRREYDILRGVVRGASNAEIARELRLREQTVKNHVSVLLQKLHVRNRVQLAVFVAREWPKLLD